MILSLVFNCISVFYLKIVPGFLFFDFQKNIGSQLEYAAMISFKVLIILLYLKQKLILSFITYSKFLLKFLQKLILSFYKMYKVPTFSNKIKTCS